MFEVKQIGKWKAVIHYDKEDNMYIIYYSGRGGAIINHENKKIAEERFKQGMEVADAISKFINFKKTGKLESTIN